MTNGYVWAEGCIISGPNSSWAKLKRELRGFLNTKHFLKALYFYIRELQAFVSLSTLKHHAFYTPGTLLICFLDLGKNKGSWVRIDVGFSGFYLASAGSSSSWLGRLQPLRELSWPKFKFVPSIVFHLLPAYMAGSQGFLFCCLKSCSESLC